MNPSPSPSTTIYQRMVDADFGLFRSLSANSYADYVSTQVNPVPSYPNFNGISGSPAYVDGWSFLALDKALSDVPPSTPREIQQDPPWTDMYCADGSWTDPTHGCYMQAQQSGFLDQTFSAAASFYAAVAEYFSYPMTASGSGPNVSYGLNTLTDAGQSFAGDAGDCVTATITDKGGFQDWVQGTIASVGGAGDHEITLTGSWSAAHSWDYNGYDTARLPSPLQPQAGNAYNIASCVPPGALAAPQAATPWPRPPSVGTVSNFEIANEPDLSYGNIYGFEPASLPAPTPVLTGASVSGGTLVPGDSYCYELAASDSTGDYSVPGTQGCLTLPGGDNAVTISWSGTSHDGNVPTGYVVYGRTAGDEQAVAGVGAWASGGLTWTDTGAVTPAGSPNTTDKSNGGNFLTPPIYTRYWNAVTSAVLAVDPAAHFTGPTVSNSIGIAGRPWLDPYCVTTSGLSSGCANGDPGWTNDEDYLPYLIANARTEPSSITFHAYGGTSENKEADNWSGLASEIRNYRASDQSLVDAHGSSVWIDEVNLSASGVGSQANGTLFQSMTQFGSAYMADNVVQWAKTDPSVTELVEHMDYSTDMSWTLFGDTDTSGDMSCVPQPACQNDRPGEPDLQYWTEYWIDRWMTPGTRLDLTNVPSGFDAVADQTDPHTIVVLVVNKRTSPVDGTGTGSPGSFDLQLQGATVTDAQQLAINGSTTWATGPRVHNLGAESNVPIDASGYEVDLIKYTVR